MTCLAVTLGSIVMDGSTDADGITWGWRALPGWWEGGEIQTDVFGRLCDDGSSFGESWRRGRAVDVVGTALAMTSSDPVETLLVARRKLVTAVDDKTDALLLVDEGDALGVLRALVRQSRTPRFPPVASERGFLFEVPLMSADWRKLSNTETQTTVGAGGVVTNAGNVAATPTLRISGDSGANVGVTNVTTGETISTTLNLAGGDVLIIDNASMTATLNGVDTPIALGSEFFDLAVGANTVNLVNAGSASLRVDYRTSWK